MISFNTYYHVYNRANGTEQLFIKDRNYDFFLKKWDYYISPIASTHAWCLMPNHFHFLVKIKEEEELLAYFKLSKNLQGFNQNLEGLVSKKISQQFSNLFNSYSKSFNKVYNRKGSLFIPRFKHKLIEDETYLKQIVLYIHNNPVHHGFTQNPLDWKYSSIHNYFIHPNKELNPILDLFDGKEEYMKTQFDFKSLNQKLEIEDD